MNFVIETNLAEVHDFIKKFPENIVKRALKRSLKRVGTSTVKEATKMLTQKKLLKIRAGEIKGKRIRSFTKTSGEFNDMLTRVYFSGKAENIGRFFAKKKTVRVGRVQWGRKRIGVTAQLPGQGRALVEGGFFMDRSKLVNANSSRYTPVMARKGDGRTPIASLNGPSIAEVAESTGIIRAASAYGIKRLQIEFEQNLNYLLQSGE